MMTLNLLRRPPRAHACNLCGRRTYAPACSTERCDGTHHTCAACRQTIAALVALDDATREADTRATLAALMAAPPAGLPS